MIRSEKLSYAAVTVGQSQANTMTSSMVQTSIPQSTISSSGLEMIGYNCSYLCRAKFTGPSLASYAIVWSEINVYTFAIYDC